MKQGDHSNAAAKCSADTAIRESKDLIEKDILMQEDSKGRSTNYELGDN